MSSQLDYILTAWAQPQALWAPHAGKSDVKEEGDTDQCNNTNV